MLTWPAKDTNEVLDYTWTPFVDAGDTLSTAMLTLVSGTVTIASQALSGGKVTVFLSGGTVGQCLFKGLATTANGRTSEEYIALSIIDKPADSGFSTKLALSSAIAAWLNRDDLTTRIPDFIRLTEARLNRLLRDPDQLVSATVTFSGGAATLPTDYGQLVAFGPTGTRLRQVTPGEFGTYLPSAGDMRVYSVSGSTINTLPTQAGAVPITYYRAIVGLKADGDSNWLLQRAPDVYLWGSLLQAEFFGWNDERLPLIRAGWDDAIAELRVDGENRRWGAAPLAAKIGRM